MCFLTTEREEYARSAVERAARFPYIESLDRRVSPGTRGRALPSTNEVLSMADLIPPHGGLKEPVNCTVAADEVGRLRTEAAGLTKVPVSDADLSTVYRFGDGAQPLARPDELGRL